MSFTCSWHLVEGSLDAVFNGEAEKQDTWPAVFAAPPDDNSPCEFRLDMDEQESLISFAVICNARLCEMYTRQSSSELVKPSYAGSIASKAVSHGRRSISVQLSQASCNGAQLILRMMHPGPDIRRFELFSWVSSPAARDGGSANVSETHTAEGIGPAVGMSQVAAVSQMLKALQPGGSSSGKVLDSVKDCRKGFFSLTAAASIAGDDARVTATQSSVSGIDQPTASAADAGAGGGGGTVQPPSQREGQVARLVGTDESRTHEQQQQPNCKPILAPSRDPMQALMASIGRAMLLKERKQQIEAQEGKQLEDIKAAVTHGRHMGALGCQPHTESGTRSDCTSSTETKLRDLQQQLLANQQEASEQHVENSAALQLLTAKVARLQTGQDVLATKVAECLNLLTSIKDVSLSAAMPAMPDQENSV